MSACRRGWRNALSETTSTGGVTWRKSAGASPLWSRPASGCGHRRTGALASRRCVTSSAYRATPECSNAGDGTRCAVQAARVAASAYWGCPMSLSMASVPSRQRTAVVARQLSSRPALSRATTVANAQGWPRSPRPGPPRHPKRCDAARRGPRPIRSAWSRGRSPFQFTRYRPPGRKRSLEIRRGPHRYGEMALELPTCRGNSLAVVGRALFYCSSC